MERVNQRSRIRLAGTHDSIVLRLTLNQRKVVTTKAKQNFESVRRGKPMRNEDYLKLCAKYPVTEKGKTFAQYRIDK